MSEPVKIIYGNVMISEPVAEEMEKSCLPRQEDFLAFTGDLTQTIQLPIASTRELAISSDKNLQDLFGAWREAGDEDESLDEIYRSRETPSSFPNDE